MAATPSPALIQWLTRFLADLTEDGPITRFELLHTVEAEHAERLDVWQVDMQNPREPHDVAQEIVDAAERDIQSRNSGQPQRYAVYAYRGDEELHESQHAFLLRPHFHATRQGEDSEPPTEKGVIAHYMRHDENVHRLLMNANESLIGRLAQDRERERGARLKAEEFNWSMFERYQALLDKEHERRIHEAKELMKARRMDELMGVVTALIPILATKLVGNTPQPANAPQVVGAQPHAELVDPKDTAVRQFLGNLSEAEISSVLGCLSSSNQIALAELHRSFMDPSAQAADVMARHLAIRKFLKGLDENEMKNILASLSEVNRRLLLALYAQYRAVEDQEQERKPEILRS